VTTADSGALYTVDVASGTARVTSAAARLVVPALPELASATLAPGVRVLLPAEEQQIISDRPGEVVINGNARLAAGGVVIGSATAFKVLGSVFNGTTTTVTTAEPTLGELFGSLRIRGTYRAAATQFGPVAAASNDAPSRVQPSAFTGEVTVSRTFTSGENGLEMSTTLGATLQAAIDYDYRREDGGLRLAQLDLGANLSLAAVQTITAGAEAGYEREIGRFRIPISVSVVDAALATVGIRVVSIQVPIYAGVRLRSEFRATLSESADAVGSIRVRYTPETGPTIDDNLSGRIAVGEANPTTPGGLPVLASVTETGSVYLRLAPGLVFLEKVAMLGVDVSLSSDNTAVLQVVPAVPSYCLALDSALNLSAHGFLKGVGFAPLKTSQFGRTLFESAPVYMGSCRAEVAVSGVIDAQQPVAQGASIPVRVTVARRTAASTAPTSTPTGNVEVVVAGARCTARLAPSGAGAAVGTCSLVATGAGGVVPIRATYGGDAGHAPGSGALQVTVAPPGATMLGSLVTLSTHYPQFGTLVTAPFGPIRVHSGIESSSGGVLLPSGIRLAAGSNDIGADYIVHQYRENSVLLSGPVNAIVYSFAPGAPRIVACALNTALSSFTTAQVAVTCTENEVRFNAPGVTITPTSRVWIDLRLLPPS